MGLLALGLSEFLGAPALSHAHTVHFYREDEKLLTEVAAYFETALLQNCSAIVIATKDHLTGLARLLKKCDIHFAQALKEGRYIPLEASKVLAQFMVNGKPNSTLCFKAIEKVLANATSASRHPGRRVVAFGEMVALLCAEGKSEAAIQLEKLWNDLAQRHFFALHCAYPVQLFSSDVTSQSLRRICAEHTGILA